MRVLLFFPPQCRPLHPHLALPIVKAELQRRGHICKVVDLNIRFYRYVLTPETLSMIRAKLLRCIKVLDGDTSLKGHNAIKFYRMTSALMRSQYLIDHVSEAVAVFKSEDFYDYGRFLWARKVLEESLDLYGSAFEFTDIGLSQLRMKYGTGSPNEIWKATEDQQENPFIETLSGWANEELKEFHPELIGISFALDEQLIPGFTLARHLRSCWNGFLVAGGSMITRLRNKLPNHSSFSSLFDKYLPYESEIELGLIADSLEGKTSSSPVNFYDLCPDFDDLPLQDYLLPTLMLPFLGSRGCSYGKCRYCSHYQTYGRYIYGNPANTARHLKTLSEKYNCKYFHFVDEALEPRFGLELAQALDSSGLDIRWMVFARIHYGWTSEVIQTIAKAGCRRLIFGLDGATERVQKLMDKNTDILHAEHVLNWCSQEGIATQINFIVGYPGEKEQEARESINFVKRNRASLLSVGVSIAMSNFVLVEEAAWDRMSIIPLKDPAKSFAIYFAFLPINGMNMKEAAVLGQELQSEADRELKSSWRYPLLREMAFLYKDRFSTEEPPMTKNAPQYTGSMNWYNRDLHDLYNQIISAKKELTEIPQEYISIWWRLSKEAAIECPFDKYLHGYQVTPQFRDNTFELSIIDAFQIPPNENLHTVVSY